MKLKMCFSNIDRWDLTWCYCFIQSSSSPGLCIHHADFCIINVSQLDWVLQTMAKWLWLSPTLGYYLKMFDSWNAFLYSFVLALLVLFPDFTLSIDAGGEDVSMTPLMKLCGSHCAVSGVLFVSNSTVVTTPVFYTQNYMKAEIVLCTPCQLCSEILQCTWILLWILHWLMIISSVSYCTFQPRVYSSLNLNLIWNDNLCYSNLLMCLHACILVSIIMFSKHSFTLLCFSNRSLYHRKIS